MQQIPLTFCKYLLCSKHKARSFIFIIVFDPQSNSMVVYKQEHSALEWLSYLPKSVLPYYSQAEGLNLGFVDSCRLCFFLHAAWKSGNAKIQMQDLSHAKHVPHHRILGQYQRRNDRICLARARYPGDVWWQTLLNDYMKSILPASLLTSGNMPSWTTALARLLYRYAWPGRYNQKLWIRFSAKLF